MPSIRICERRRRAEATSSIALVTLRVFVIERTRRFRSWVDAKVLGAFLVAARLEAALDLLELAVQLLGRLVGQVARVADRRVDRAVGTQVLAQLVLEARDVL